MIIEALSGLGIFLFGMFYMEHALKEALGFRFKRWIRNSTSTPFRSLLTGAGATAMLQSSSVVSLMTLSFVSASLISLPAGIAVIFGSNVGTTVTAWIVATLGFKVQIELFALPMIGLGGFFLILGKSHKKLAAVAQAMIGFGLLFFGLEVMKMAIEFAAQNIDLSQYTQLHLVAFLGLGFILTAMIQSSSAATAIALSALYANILSFDQSAAMVIGTNVGTTVTALLGGIGGIPDKKRAAVAHLLFNIITGLVAYMLLPLLSFFLMDTLDFKDNPTIALAIFHTIFNLLGVILLMPFIPLMARYLEKIFVYDTKQPTKFIHKVDAHIPDTALIALRDEANRLFVKSIKFVLLLANIKPTTVLGENNDIKESIAKSTDRIEFDYSKSYEKLKEIESSTVAFVSTLIQQNLTVKQSEYLEVLSRSVRESVYAAKILKDIKNNLDDFSESENQDIVHIYNEIRKNLAYSMIIFSNYMEDKWSEELCLEKFEKADERKRQILHETTSLVTKDRRSRTMVVSLLNANHSVSICIQSLREASKSLKLQFLLENSDKTEEPVESSLETNQQ